jgi:hypothetical protein
MFDVKAKLANFQYMEARFGDGVSVACAKADMGQLGGRPARSEAFLKAAP